MHIVVTELSVEQALRRARARFEQADLQLAQALAAADAAIPWLAIGAIALAVGLLGIWELLPLPVDASPLEGVSLVLGGACIGYGLPAWLRALGSHRRSLREWHAALDLLQLREQQAEADPGLAVEVLDRVDAAQPLNLAAWKTGMTAAAGRYVQ